MTRNGTSHPVAAIDTLAAQLVTAKATGHVAEQLAPALIALLEDLYSALAAGQVASATESLTSIIGPALALGQARQTLVTSLVAMDAALLDYQRRRGPVDAARLASDPALLADISARLHQTVDAAEDAATRIDHYLRLLPPTHG